MHQFVKIRNQLYDNVNCYFFDVQFFKRLAFAIFGLLFLSCLFSCSPAAKKEDGILHIDLREKQEEVYVNISEVISDLEYVVLETSPACFIGEVVDISISDNYIVAYSKPNCYLFSRQGKFIRKIGNRGNGPFEYSEDNYNIKIDEKSDRIYLMSMGEICAYRINGEFVKKLNLWQWTKKTGLSIHLSNWTHWKDELFCANFTLDSGKEPYRFIIFTLDGEIVKLFPNHIFFDFHGRYTSLNSEADVYCFNEQLYFRERLCDTLFRITDQLDLAPEIVFNVPGPKIPIDLRGQYDGDYSSLQDIREVAHYLFLTGHRNKNGFYILYNRHNNQSTFLKHDLSTRREVTTITQPGGSLFTRTQLVRGLINDIDGGLPFWPHHLCNIQNNKQLVAVRKADQLKELLTDEYFAAHTIKDMEAHNRLRNLLKNLDWEDNPVLMIATFK